MQMEKKIKHLVFKIELQATNYAKRILDETEIIISIFNVHTTRTRYFNKVYIRRERYYNKVTQEYYSLKDSNFSIKSNIKFD